MGPFLFYFAISLLFSENWVHASPLHEMVIRSDAPALEAFITSEGPIIDYSLKNNLGFTALEIAIYNAKEALSLPAISTKNLKKALQIVHLLLIGGASYTDKDCDQKDLLNVLAHLTTHLDKNDSAEKQKLRSVLEKITILLIKNSDSKIKIEDTKLEESLVFDAIKLNDYNLLKALYPNFPIKLIHKNPSSTKKSNRHEVDYLSLVHRHIQNFVEELQNETLSGKSEEERRSSDLLIQFVQTNKDIRLIRNNLSELFNSNIKKESDQIFDSKKLIIPLLTNIRDSLKTIKERSIPSAKSRKPYGLSLQLFTVMGRILYNDNLDRGFTRITVAERFFLLCLMPLLYEEINNRNIFDTGSLEEEIQSLISLSAKFRNRKPDDIQSSLDKSIGLINEICGYFEI